MSVEISLKEFILQTRSSSRYILSKWLIILCFGILGGIVGFTYAYLKKPIFTATTTFVLEDGDKGGGLGQYAGIASMVGIDMGGGGSGLFEGDNILELYKSRTMIEKTLLSEVVYKEKKQLLIDHFIDFSGLRERWANNPQLKSIQFINAKLQYSESRLQDSVLGGIAGEINRKYLSVTKLDKKLSIIKVDVNAEDEFFAKLFNDQIVKNVNDFYVQTKTKKSLDNVSILSQKVDSVRGVMNGAIYSAAAVADATPNLNPTRQAQRIAPIQRSQFNAETNKTILGELVKNLELSKISLMKETPLIQVVDQPVFPLDIVKFGKTKGLIIGGLLGVFLTIVVLLIKRLIKSVMV